MSVAELMNLIQSGGPTALLVTMIVLLIRGTIITEGQYKEMLNEKQLQINEAVRREGEWKTIATSGVRLAERSLIATKQQPTP